MKIRKIANDGNMPELWASLPFPSAVLQMADDVFKAGNRKKQNDEGKKYSETCPKCKKPFEYYYDNFF